MDYNDKLAIMAAILLAARMGRGNPMNGTEVALAVKTAKDICDAI